ncbi:hypothetical protein CENSYa_1835 [Cenarchaeum symbiosum A]|uniref:HTH marR-type domain-containing protein n=1 Tax=Cenarchaeum symbiosum (strain A) TaxID=414004 RepID=A0RYM8_CENSY|nr:hypothetical protein CENSYa_1835 [Cenarchaeum symbiosum A]
MKPACDNRFQPESEIISFVNDKSHTYHTLVILAEVLDLGAVLAIISMSLAGVLGFLLYHRTRPRTDSAREMAESDHLDRLEYYERQLIDMKIRMDALDMTGQEEESDPAVINDDPDQTQSDVSDVVDTAKVDIVPETVETPPRYNSNITEHVLQLITEKPLTSRDIQITIKRTREHTSRLMKRLSEEGLVERHVDKKPYIYSITGRGKERLERGE